MNRTHAITYSVFAVVVLLLVLALVGVIPLPRNSAWPAPMVSQEPAPKPAEPKAPEPKRAESPSVRRVALPEGFESASGQAHFFYAYTGGPVDAWIEVEALGATTEAVRVTSKNFWVEPKADPAALDGTILWAPGAGKGEFAVSLRESQPEGQGGTATHTDRRNNVGAAIAKLLPSSTEKLQPGGEHTIESGGVWALEVGKPVTLRSYWAYEKDVKTYTVRLRCQLVTPAKPKP